VRRWNSLWTVDRIRERTSWGKSTKHRHDIAEQGTRLKYVGILDRAGVPTTKRKEIPSGKTRLGTMHVDITDHDEANNAFAKVVQRIEEFSRTRVVAYNKALSDLR
jgi:hypothetical protein